MQNASLALTVLAIALVCIAIIASTGNARTINADPGTFSGKVRYVTDGDTFFIGDHEIRLWGVDAPEMKQPFYHRVSGQPVPAGRQAQQALRRIVKGKTVTCRIKHRDRFGRIVGQCFIGTEDIGRIMIQQGHAFDWPHYSRGLYAADEQYARSRGNGIWTTRFDSTPWTWRRLNP